MAAVALIMIIIQILCVYIPTSAYTMIKADLDGKKIELAGSIDQIGTECVLVMKQIFNKNKQTWGVLGAQGVLVNLLMLTLDDSVGTFGIEPQWKDKNSLKMQELMGGMDFNQEVMNQFVQETPTSEESS